MTKRDYIDFQDRSDPIAYLITIRCYGTWLHGDARGSMDRKEYNRYGTPKMPTKPGLKKSDADLLKSPPLKLGTAHRQAIRWAIRNDCLVRGHRLYALNVRTNHVHSVVSASNTPEYIMNRFKSYATRRLREEGVTGVKEKVWARHGSTKYLWTDQHIARAIEYVLYERGDELPNFD